MKPQITEFGHANFIIKTDDQFAIGKIRYDSIVIHLICGDNAFKVLMPHLTKKYKTNSVILYDIINPNIAKVIRGKINIEKDREGKKVICMKVRWQVN